LVNALLESSADVDAVQFSRRTPLMYAAMHGSVGICRALLKHGATVEAIDNTEETALIFAVRGGHTATVELLLSYGADANAENFEAESVLDMSLERARHGGEAAKRAEEITALLRQKLKEV
jgi:ankyrin repeat protein